MEDAPLITLVIMTSDQPTEADANLQKGLVFFIPKCTL